MLLSGTAPCIHLGILGFLADLLRRVKVSVIDIDIVLVGLFNG